MESGELVAGEATDGAREVELSGVEGKSMSGLWSVTNHAFAAAGDAPMLGDHGASLVDAQIEVLTFIVNECRFRSRFIPPIAHPIGPAVGFDEEAGFDAFLGAGISALQFEIKVFHPKHAVGQGPAIVLGPGHLARPIGNAEPALFDGVVAPEGEIDVVGVHSGSRGEVGQVGEETWPEPLAASTSKLSELGVPMVWE